VKGRPILESEKKTLVFPFQVSYRIAVMLQVVDAQAGQRQSFARSCGSCRVIQMDHMQEAGGIDGPGSAYSSIQSSAYRNLVS
jgi:hypothetical protein